jgi:signal peptidase
MMVKLNRADTHSDHLDDISDEDVREFDDNEGQQDQDESDFNSEEDMEEDEKPFRSAFWDILKDVIIAFIIVIIIISSIYIYTGNWPPVVVVESDSMQHSDDESFLGVIDTGDLVLVKAIESENDVIPYMKGKRTGHETYGEYGDVLIYRKNGYTDTTPVIHRAIVWLRYNQTGNSFDIPELKYHNAGEDEDWYVISGENRWYNLSGSIVLRQIGFDAKDRRDIIINLGNILNNYAVSGVEPHSGFITLGDHNRGNYDQNMLPDGHQGRVRPVRPQWVVGKARGELPWFGLIKLYFQDNSITDRAPQNSFTMLYVSLILIFAVPITIDIILILYDRRRERMVGFEKERDIEKSSEEEIIEEEEPPPDDFDDEPPPLDDEDEELPPPDEEEPPPPDDEDEEPPPPDDENEEPPPPDD